MKKISIMIVLIAVLTMLLCSCSREKCDVCNKYGAKHIIKAITTWNLCDDCFETHKHLIQGPVLGF